MDSRRPQPAGLLALLVLAALTLIVVDARDTHGPVRYLRDAAGAVFGPAEDSAAAVVRPVARLRERVRSADALRRDNDRLRSEVSALRWRTRTSALDAARATALRRLGAFADARGYRVVSAQVVGLGPAQSFRRTAVIDVGTRDGVRNDVTVIDADGLVGRVIRVTRSTATVLLIVDADSTVGGRLGGSRELGFVKGGGSMSGTSTLSLSLVDTSVSMRRGDRVVSWGSRGGAPYLPGVPVGQVVSVRRSAGDVGEVGLIRPYVDFSSLDVVGVIVAGPGDATASSGTGQPQAAGASSTSGTTGTSR